MDISGNKKLLHESKIKKIIMYILCLVLVVFYLLVLWWGSHPDVPLEYKMFYLTHELVDWPGYDNLAYKLGTKEFCYGKPNENNAKSEYPICQRKGSGWNPEQMEGVVNEGNVGYIYYIPTESSESLMYTIQVREFSGSGNVKVYINDNMIGQFEKTGTYSFQAGSVEKGEMLTVKFVSDNCEYKLWSLILE